jgi:DNA-binding transcriptional LysR family regulator
MESLHASAESVRAMGTEPRGRVRISCPPDVYEPLADFVASFGKRHPLVQVEASFTTRHVDLVAEGFDLALQVGPLQDSPLLVRRIMTTTLGIFAAPAYLRKRGTPGTPDDLARHDAIGLKTGNDRVRWTLTGPEEREASVELHCSTTTDMMMFSCSAAERGLGLALLPEVLAGGLVEAGKLVRVLPAWQRREQALSVVSPSRAFEPLAVRLFKEGLIDEFSRLHARWG